MYNQILLACLSRVACSVDSKLTAMSTVMKQHFAVEFRSTMIVELRELSKDLKVLAAHLNSHLHCLGVRVVVETFLLICCQEGVEFEQEGTDVDVLEAHGKRLSVGRHDTIHFQVAAQELLQFVKGVLA